MSLPLEFLYFLWTMPRPGDDRRRGGGRRRARREQWEVSARALGGVFVMCDEKRDRPSPERSVGAVVWGGGVAEPNEFGLNTQRTPA